jgi:hypothetical protein
MNKQLGCFFVFISFSFFNFSQSQELIKSDSLEIQSDVFLESDILPIKLSYSIKEVKKETNDSTYIDSKLDYRLKDGSWQSLPIQLRSRGNYRLKNCYFPPLKMKTKKADSKNTLFEGHKNFKIVMPCLLQSDNNDNIVKEYMAYKLFEMVSPYHFKSRLLAIDFEEDKGSKTKSFNLKGILVEDDKKMAKRLDGNVYDRSMHPLNQEALSSIRNAIFQYMIGNTDFSQAYQHNIKVVYIDKNMVPVPYDFDMAGFVNCSYAVVSQIQGESLGMESVTERKFRGFARDIKLYEQVRQEFINNKQKLISILDSNASFFEDPKEFSTAKNYILSFFEVLENSQKFKSEILDQAREQ